MASEIERPRNCGECVKFWRDEDRPGHGYCDNWGGVDLTEDCVCHPNLGVKKEKCASQSIA